jgi:hypothetical protein
MRKRGDRTLWNAGIQEIEPHARPVMLREISSSLPVGQIVSDELFS